MNNNDTEAIDELAKMIVSPIYFIEKMWGLTPQPIICSETHDHSFPCFGLFVLGKNITWQQTQVLQAIEKGKKRISVASGNRVGKDAMLSWLIHWYLFCHHNAQVGCTAPSTNQMYDVLWKELSLWHQRLPEGIKEKFEWSTTHFKMKENPNAWWARARTARKENPEAFAGLHGNFIFLVVDEASAVPDEVITAGEGALGGENNLVIYVGNPTRLEGFFYDSHHKDKSKWTTFQFDGRESPNVSQEFISETIAKYNEDSDEFRWKIRGLFPKAEGIDKGGWMQLLKESDLRFVEDVDLFRNAKMGIDPSGEGNNKTAIVIRDPFKAKVVCIEEISTPKSVAEKALTLMAHYEITAGRVTVDNFGSGANVSQEIALATHDRIAAVNVGDKADDEERFINKRAECYWRLREWIITGGLLVKHSGWKELLTIRYKRTLKGKIQIMSKVDMKDKYGYESPDVSDALSLSFLQKDFAIGTTHSTSKEFRDMIKRRNVSIGKEKKLLFVQN